MNPELHPATALPTAFVAFAKVRFINALNNNNNNNSARKHSTIATLLFVWSSYLAYGPSPLSCMCKSVMCNCSILITNVTIMKDLITKRSRTDITVYVLFTIHISQHYNTERWKKTKTKYEEETRQIECPMSNGMAALLHEDTTPQSLADAHC